MGNPNRLERVITLPTGSLLEYSKGPGESFYFYDANHNLQLDSSDSKVIEKHLGNRQSEFETAKVLKADLRRFGPEAKAALAQARKERTELRKSVPSATAGRCFALSTAGGVVSPHAEELAFRPGLTLRTVRADPDKFYSLLQLMNHSEKDPLDPARCFMARAVLPRAKLSKSTLSAPGIVLATGDLLSPKIFQALGLTNGERLDAAYSILEGAQRVHIDLTPLP
jgi:hypothetical protein